MRLSMKPTDSIPPLAATATLVFTMGCGDSGHPPPRDSDSAATIRGTPGAPKAVEPPSAPACVEGTVQECRVEHATNEGIESCFVGLQVCTGQEWSLCMDEDRAEELLTAQSEEE